MYTVTKGGRGGVSKLVFYAQSTGAVISGRTGGGGGGGLSLICLMTSEDIKYKIFSFGGRGGGDVQCRMNF